MKILVVCQYYYPEPFRITDICEELVKRGHEVTVVTGVPNYPMGEIYDGYEKNNRRDEVINGVKVHRCFTIPRKTGTLFRFLNYYSYAFSSMQYIKTLPGDFDVVFVNQLSPVMMACAGIKYKKLHDKKLVLYCLDLWPESLTVGGIKQGSLIYKIFDKISKRIYLQADKILCTSKSFAKYFEDHFGITDTEYLPQYAEDIFNPDECRKEPNSIIDLMFAGNIGKAQSVDTIIEAAKLTKDNPNIRWHIVGDGAELPRIKEMAQGLDNVIFYGRKPINEMPKYYAMADAMLVTMEKGTVASMTLPGKIQTYMAAGKPIIGAVDGEAELIINEAKCGKTCTAEDSDGLASLAFEYEPKCDYCTNTFAFYKTFFDKTKFIDKLENQMGAFL